MRSHHLLKVVNKIVFALKQCAMYCAFADAAAVFDVLETLSNKYAHVGLLFELSLERGVH